MRLWQSQMRDRSVPRYLRFVREGDQADIFLMTDGEAPEWDPGAQKTMRAFGLKLAVVTVSAMAAGMLAASPSTGFLLAFEFLCFWISLLAIAFALARRREPQQRKLDLWDEALAFGALALLAHVVKSFLGQ
jgi:hypothetical protein